MTTQRPQGSPCPLVIVGAGGFGREILEVVHAINEDSSVSGPAWEFVGFIDDSEPTLPSELADTSPWLGPIEAVSSRLPADTYFVVAIGDPHIRQRIAGLLEAQGHLAATLVHPLASLGSRVLVGSGSIISAHATLTTDITIGKHVIVNINSTIGHDCVIDGFVTVSPLCAISGAARIGTLAYLGSGAVLLPGVHVGDSSVVGAGAVVTRDVPPVTTVIGVPAHVVRGAQSS